MDLVALRAVCDSIPDWWALTTTDVERLAKAQLGVRVDGWLRKGSEQAIVASKKFGAVAATLDQELIALTKGALLIRKPGHIDTALKAVVWYHVRFENIHPLHDGNGRVGRIIMTGQLYQACQIPPAFFERHLVAHQIDYRLAFEAINSAETFRQLYLLLARITRTRASDGILSPEFSFEPMHKSPGSPQSVKTSG